MNVKKKGLNLAQEELNGVVLESHSFKQGKVKLPKYGRMVLDKDINKIKFNIGEPHRPHWITLATEIIEAAAPVNRKVVINDYRQQQIDYLVGQNVPYLVNIETPNISSSLDLDVSAYVTKYKVWNIGVKLTSGVAGILYAGFSAGQDDLILSTDLSFMSVDQKLTNTCEKMFSPGETHIHVSFSGGTAAVYTVYVTLNMFR